MMHPSNFIPPFAENTGSMTITTTTTTTTTSLSTASNASLYNKLIDFERNHSNRDYHQALAKHLETMKCKQEIDAIMKRDKEENIVVEVWLLSAQKGKNSIVFLLLQNSMNVNATDRFGFTALMSAVIESRIETMRLLLRCGANVHSMDSRGMNALMWATQRGNDSAIALLTQYNAVLLLKRNNDDDVNDEEEEKEEKEEIATAAEAIPSPKKRAARRSELEKLK